MQVINEGTRQYAHTGRRVRCTLRSGNWTELVIKRLVNGLYIVKVESHDLRVRKSYGPYATDYIAKVAQDMIATFMDEFGTYPVEAK